MLDPIMMECVAQQMDKHSQMQERSMQQVYVLSEQQSHLQYQVKVHGLDNVSDHSDERKSHVVHKKRSNNIL